jgi:hypothetical protein
MAVIPVILLGVGISSEAKAYKINYDYPYQLGPFGGGGGNSRAELKCYNGDVIVGLTGRSGQYVDLLSISCAPLHADGTLGMPYTRLDSFGLPIQFGGNGGSSFAPENCPPGQAAIGVHGHSGDSLDALGLECAPPPFVNPQTGSQTVETPSWGGGNSFLQFCPNNNLQGWNGTGYVLDGIVVQWGDWIDSIEPICDYVAP